VLLSEQVYVHCARTTPQPSRVPQRPYKQRVLHPHSKNGHHNSYNQGSTPHLPNQVAALLLLLRASRLSSPRAIPSDHPAHNITSSTVKQSNTPCWPAAPPAGPTSPRLVARAAALWWSRRSQHNRAQPLPTLLLPSLRVSRVVGGVRCCCCWWAALHISSLACIRSSLHLRPAAEAGLHPPTAQSYAPVFDRPLHHTSPHSTPPHTTPTHSPHPTVTNGIIFRQLFDGASSTYTYLLADPLSRDALLIDPVLEQVRAWGGVICMLHASGCAHARGRTHGGAWIGV